MATKRKVLTMGSGFGGRIPGELHFRALRTDWDYCVGILIRHTAPGPIGRQAESVATSVTFERIPEDEGAAYAVDPTLKLGLPEAQQLMDELWRAGVRPVEAHGTSGQLQAMEKHLDDMRRIAGGALDINLAREVVKVRR